MKIHAQPLLAGLFLLVLAVPGGASANMLLNGDFSQWDNPGQPTGWLVENDSLSTVSQEATTTHSGPYSAKLTRNVAGTGSNYGLKQFIPVVQNESYSLIAWGYDTDENARGGISITWCREDSTSLGNTGVAYTDSAIRDWQTLTRAAVAPDSPALRYAKVLVRVYGFTGGLAGGVVYFDDVDFAVGAIAEESPAATRRAEFSVMPTIGTREMKVSLVLPAAANVTLSVYDLAGALRSEIFCGSLAAGRHNLTIDAGRTTALPDGLYFAVLTGTAGSPLVRKLTIQH